MLEVAEIDATSRECHLALVRREVAPSGSFGMACSTVSRRSTKIRRAEAVIGVAGAKRLSVDVRPANRGIEVKGDCRSASAAEPVINRRILIEPW